MNGNQSEDKMYKILRPLKIKVRPSLGKSIHVIVDEALKLANDYTCSVVFEFSGVEVIVTPNEENLSVVRRYYLDKEIKKGNQKPQKPIRDVLQDNFFILDFSGRSVDIQRASVYALLMYAKTLDGSGDKISSRIYDWLREKGFSLSLPADDEHMRLIQFMQKNFKKEIENTNFTDKTLIELVIEILKASKDK